MKKKNLVVANWKMNPASFEEAKPIVNGVRNFAKKLKYVDVVVCPPFPFLHPFLKVKLPKNLSFGVQNISSEEKGAFTGEVSAIMAKNFGAKFAIIGHSERRYPTSGGGETNEIIKKKLQMAFMNGITPILCIGERERSRNGEHLEFIKTQIKECLSGIQKKNLLGLTIAYEPIWAIGKSYREAMSPTDVHETTLFIQKIAGELFGRDIAESFKVLYGGSVESANAESMIRQGNVSGFLVGHASLLPVEFNKILEAANIK